MAKSRIDMIIESLRDNPDRKFTARELAELFMQRYPTEISEKRQNPRYNTDEKLITQLAAEIGGERTVEAKRRCPNIATQDKPRPRLYYWDEAPSEQCEAKAPANEISSSVEQSLVLQSDFSESDLYPILIEFLHKEFGLYCQRIDEKTSKNSRGLGGNHWLHPDIVALETLDQGWDAAVKDCVRHSNDSSVRLWSFEVKKQLTKGNVRECFFQAVSNSTWANFGYLVATGISNEVESELQMLSGLHGIGVLLLNTDSLFDSEILIPARERTNIDWQSVNRIVTENADFHRFIEQVGIYSQTGRLVASVWNK